MRSDFVERGAWPAVSLGSEGMRAAEKVIAAALVAAVLASGCASSPSPAPQTAQDKKSVRPQTSGKSTSGVFKDYRASFAVARAAIDANSLPGAESVFAADAAREGGAGLLANLELGAIYQSFGDFERSRSCLDRADAIAREIENRAVISGKDTGRTVASLFTNDRAIEFKSDSYEKVMARTLDAIDYLMLGDLESARVEIRKAAEYQDAERRKYEDRLAALAAEPEQAKKERQYGEQGLRASKEFSATLARMDEAARDFENSFQNPFTYFLSGLVYELNGELDDAFIDYRRAYQLWPSSYPAASFLASTAVARSRADDLESLEKPIDPQIVLASKDSRRAGSGRLVVIFGADLIPQKQEIKFPIPVPGVNELAWVAFATYTDYQPTQERLIVNVGTDSVRTEPIANLRALAVRALQEKWKATAARQVGRVVAKAVAKHEMEKQMAKAGPLAQLIASVAGTVYQIASERADDRGWYALPDQLQVVGLTLPAGENQVELLRTATGESRHLQVEIRPNRPTVVFVRGHGHRFGAWAQALAPGQTLAAGGR